VTLDPAALQVLISRLTGVAEEMGAVLWRAAFRDLIPPGGQVVVNDPFAGGTHLNDITLVAPCRIDGRLVGWAANRAHHADVGGAAPGLS
jgi:N-methylhydantoinase B